MKKPAVSIVQYWEGKARFNTVMGGAGKKCSAILMNG
jgi:hypothetical protein